MAFDEQRTGEFFKPKDHTDAYAFLVEVKRDAPQSPGYKGEKKDAVYADITVFKTEADLVGEPKVYRNSRIDASLLQRELRDNVGIGNETVRVLGQWKGERSTQPSWVWKYTDADTRKAVIDWYSAREESLANVADEFAAAMGG